MLTFYVPPGIGDFSPMYQKFCNMDRDITIRVARDGPDRLGPFLDILPKVKNGGYAAHYAVTAMEATLPPHTDLASLPDGDYFLSINRWMEEGGKTSDWIPGPTTYHYEMRDTGVTEAKQFLNTLPEGPIVGIYTSAYGNSRHWGFWDYTIWRKFLDLISSVLPTNTQFLFIGAEYDLAISDTLHGWMQSVGKQSHLLIGQFHIGGTIEIIRHMDYFFSFPSGLAFLADVVNTPHIMWLPRSMEAMVGSFVDPVNYENRRSHHALFTNPESAFQDFKEIGLKFVEEACHKNQKSL